MKVSEAVAGRRSVRAFLDRPVDSGQLADLLARAGRAASGGNLQPWSVYLVNGPAMAAFRAEMAPRLAAGLVDEPEYPVYPSPLAEPWRSRRFEVGEALYATLGIPRTDRAARLAWFARNWDFFGAPAAAFIFTDRAMGAAQWSDLGGYLATAMLLMHESGLASCAQEAWVAHHSVVRRITSAPATAVFFAGIAIGHPDPDAPVNSLITRRAPVGEWLFTV